MVVCCDEHWSCIERRILRSRISNPVLYWIIVQDTIYLHWHAIILHRMYNLGHIWAIFGQKFVVWQSSPMRGTFLDHIWSKSAAWGSPPMKGTFLGHIWSKSAAWQSPPMKGTFLGHIWPKSAVWQIEVCPYRDSSLGNRDSYVGILLPTRNPLP